MAARLFLDIVIVQIPLLLKLRLLMGMLPLMMVGILLYILLGMKMVHLHQDLHYKYLLMQLSEELVQSAMLQLQFH